jgi:hypothetical protein
MREAVGGSPPIVIPSHPNNRRKAMSKNNNLNSFKSITIALTVLAVLFIDGIARGQSFIIVSAIMPDGAYASAMVACSLYSTSDTSNNVFTNNVNPATEKKERLAYRDTSNLAFPVSGQTPAGQTRSISAADVDRLFDTAYLSAGYTRGDGASATMSMNCHGFSTGKEVWLPSFSAIHKEVDYDERSEAKFLADLTQAETLLENHPSTIITVLPDGIVLATSDHSVRMRSSGTAKKVNGEIEKKYKVLRTSEKYNASAIYDKEINLDFEETDDFSLGVVTGLNQAPTAGGQTTSWVTTGTVTNFYKPK